MSSICSGKAAVFVITCLFACLSVSAVAQQTQPPATPPPIPQENQNPSQNQAKPAQPPAPTAGGAPVDSSKYKIGPADVLLIRVWNEPQFSGPVAVHEDGKITLLLVGDLDAGGKTPLEVQEIITKALQKYVVKPLVTVTVQDVGSKQYYLDGLVARPGEYPLIVPTTVFEALSKAGGVQDFANKKKIYVLRGDKQIPFHLNEVEKGKHLEQNILLQPGDHVIVR